MFKPLYKFGIEYKLVLKLFINTFLIKHIYIFYFPGCLFIFLAVFLSSRVSKQQKMHMFKTKAHTCGGVGFPSSKKRGRKI